MFLEMFAKALDDFSLIILREKNRCFLSLSIRAKPVRTASGIAVVAVMCKPHRCPHISMTGNICVYCPGGPDSDFEYSTQSYTGYEPTSMRAIRARYNPYLQAKHRVDQVKTIIFDLTHKYRKEKKKYWPNFLLIHLTNVETL